MPCVESYLSKCASVFASVKSLTATTFKFWDKQVILTKTLKDNVKETFSQFVNLVAAMNYGRVIQGKSYTIDEAWTLEKAITEENLVLLEPDVLKDVDAIHEHLKKAKKLYHVTLFPLKKRCGYALKALDLAQREAKTLEGSVKALDLMQQPERIQYALKQWLLTEESPLARRRLEQLLLH